MTDHEKILVALMSGSELPDDELDRVRPLELMALLRNLGGVRSPAARV